MTEAPTIDDLDDRAAAFNAGRIDARHNQPRRFDLGDRSPIGAAYHEGYDHRCTDACKAAAR